MSENNGRVGVTFDLWETLIFDKPELDEARGRMRCEGLRDTLGTLGISLTIEDVKRGYDESASVMQDVWDQNKEISTFGQVHLILELAGVPVARIPTSQEAMQRLVKAYADPILTMPPRLGGEVVGALENVRALGAKIGLISNTGRAPGVTLRQMLQNYDVLKFFDATTFSNETGCRKPDPRIFKQTANALGIGPSRVLHVGDNPDADFNGARRAGMKAVLYEPELRGISEWGPNSLFALSRRHKHPSGNSIKSDLRIHTLRSLAPLVQRFAALEG